jgi:hypothetical protein
MAKKAEAKPTAETPSYQFRKSLSPRLPPAWRVRAPLRRGDGCASAVKIFRPGGHPAQRAAPERRSEGAGGEVFSDQLRGRTNNMKTFLLIVCFCTAFSAVADEKTITNKVENSESLNTATNIMEMTVEQRLLTAFPQLSWSRAKLEFSFEMQAEIASALAVGANSEDEAFKWAKKKETMFKKDDDIKMFTKGWKLTGRIHSETVYFSKSVYTLSGITGEIGLLFDRGNLIHISFYTDGSDTDFSKLYQVLIRACNSPGQRVINGKDDSEIDWTVLGSTNRYDIQLSHNKSINKLNNSTEVVRGVTIFVKRPTRESAPKG